MAKVLLVDDEPAILHAFRRAYRDGKTQLITASSAEEAVKICRQEQPDAILMDVHLPDASGLSTFRELRSIDPLVPIIVITGHGTTDLAIEAMKEGAFEFLLKPLEWNDVRTLIESATRASRLMRVPAEMPEIEPASQAGDQLIGRCPAMHEVYKAIGRVAATDATVLLLGESGTGKELVARAIYQHSLRAGKPFVALNCGAIPENLVESELFGHERGAFTGAERRRIGKFESANRGTIFLDEIAELPLPAQVKMLRILQERKFERVGGEETLAVDVRVIAATNRELEKAVELGQFRQDLYFRLNVFAILLPPLRERGDDIILLTDYFLRRFAADFGSPLREIHPDAIAELRSRRWPGNVRELQSVLKQAILRSRGSVLLPEALVPPTTSRPALLRGSELFDWDAFVEERIAAGSQNLYAEGVERMEREIVVRVLRSTDGNQLRAARILGITRGNLRNKIRNLGISIERAVWSDEDQDDS